MIPYYTAIAIFFIPFILWYKSRPSRFPPGPTRLPVINNLHNMLLGKDLISNLEGLHKKHGQIMSLCFIGHKFWDVWLDGYELIREVLHDSRFTDRTDFELIKILGADKGIAFSLYKIAKHKRRAVMSAMRSLFIGDASFVAGVENQIFDLIKHLDKLRERPINLQVTISYAVHNVISKLLFDVSYSLEDPDFVLIHKKLMRSFELTNPTRLMFILPYSIGKHLPDAKELRSLQTDVSKYVERLYLERKQAMSDGESIPTCVADSLWKYFFDSSTDPFPEEHIVPVLVDLIMAGQETTSGTLGWAFLTMIHFPGVQAKVYDELLELFPDKDYVISLSDMGNCHYTQAALNEVQRWTPIAISTIEHAAVEDVDNFHGYRIPKGTRMMPNFLGMNRNKKYWKHPNEFNPSNFLDDDGKFMKSRYLMPFAVGLRACPGEYIARMELFMVFANVMRHFSVSISGALPKLSGSMGFLSLPPKYEVKLVRRID